MTSRLPRTGAQRIAVSAAMLTSNRVTGIERFTIGLLSALLENCPDHRELHLLGPAWLRDYVSAHVYSPPAQMPRPIINEIWVPTMLHRLQAQALHTVAYGPPLLLRKPWVATVHDLVPWERPETLGRAGRYYLAPSMKLGLRLRRRVQAIAPAEATAAGLRRLFGRHLQVWMVPEGVSGEFSPGPPPADGPPWRLLTVGTIEPRKGLPALAAAVARLATGGTVVEARVAGRRGWGTAFPPGALVELGYVSDDELREEYRAAHLLVAPSEMEGFDLPVLEALASGLPVLASDIPVHREHFGDAAVLVPPRDAEALAAGIERLLTDSRERERRRALGLKVAERFSWDAAARRVHAIYDGLCVSPA
jgi:glycosyltransferase involved in cell wall biosynthesis